MAFYLRYTTVTGKYMAVPAFAIALNQDFDLSFDYMFEGAGFGRPLGSSSGTSDRVLIPDTGTNTVTITCGSSPSVFNTGSYDRYVWNTFRFVRVSNDITAYLNGVSLGTLTNGTPFTPTRLFAHGGNYSNNSAMRNLTLSVGGSPTREYVNATGTGTVWPEIISGLDGTQVGTWPADNAEWVFYDAGGATAYDDTLSGAGYSASIGTLASARGFNDTLNGVTYSGDVGNMIATRGLSSELSGATYSAEIGSLSSLRGYSSLLSAADYGAAIGELISTLDGATAYSDLLSGISATVAIGDLVSSVQRASILNGLAYGFSVGDFTSSAGYNSALSGVNYSSSIGQLTSTLSGEVTVTIEGYTIRFADSAVAAVYADDSISVIYAN